MKLLTLAMLLFAAAAAHAQTLYEALGGERGLQEFVSEYVDVLTTDPITGPSFTDSSRVRFANRNVGFLVARS